MQTEHFVERPDDITPNTVGPENPQLQRELSLLATIALGRQSLQKAATEAHRRWLEAEDRLDEAARRHLDASQMVADVLRDAVKTWPDLNEVLDVWYGSYRSQMYEGDEQEVRDAVARDEKDRATLWKIMLGAPFIDLRAFDNVPMAGVVTSVPYVGVKNGGRGEVELGVSFSVKRSGGVAIIEEDRRDTYFGDESEQDEDENEREMDDETSVDGDDAVTVQAVDEQISIGLTGLSERMVVGAPAIHEFLQNYTPPKAMVKSNPFYQPEVDLNHAELTIRLLDAVDALDLRRGNEAAVNGMIASLVTNTRTLLDMGAKPATEFDGFPDRVYASTFLRAVKRYDDEAYQLFLDTFAVQIVNASRQDLVDEIVDFLSPIELEKQSDELVYMDRKDILMSLRERAIQLRGVA